MNSLFHGLGYYFNDDRASGGKLVEDDTMRCAHCPQGLLKADWIRRGSLRCVSCNQPLCEACGRMPPTLKCLPEEGKLERALNEAYRREQNSKLLGL